MKPFKRFRVDPERLHRAEAAVLLKAGRILRRHLEISPRDAAQFKEPN